MDSGTYPFPNAGERQPTVSHGGGIQEYLGTLVSCWLLASGLSFAEETNKIRDVLKDLILKNVRGLLILEDGNYLAWPDILDPRQDPNQVVSQRAGTLRGFASELHNWPPLTALKLVEPAVAEQYEALERGLAALADVYQAMLQAGVRRVPLNARHSVLGIAPRNAWRVMLVNPLDSSPVGQVFVALQKSGLVAAWLPKPELSGVASTLANR